MRGSLCEASVGPPQEGLLLKYWLSAAVCEAWLLLAFSRDDVFGLCCDRVHLDLTLGTCA